ncbi:Villin-4, partial [Mucuna pruriens]
MTLGFIGVLQDGLQSSSICNKVTHFGAASDSLCSKLFLIPKLRPDKNYFILLVLDLVMGPPRELQLSLASKMVESMKFLPCQGGVSDGYKNYIATKEIPNETYSEDGVALFRIQGSGPDNMQAIQVEPIASSLNSTYSYILHSGPTVFTWSGSLTTSDDQKLVERMLDVIKPDLQCRPQKEGVELEQFWDLLGGKSEYASQKIVRDAENDPNLFSCNFSVGKTFVNSIDASNIMKDVMTLCNLFSKHFHVTDIASKVPKVNVFVYNHMIFLSWMRRKEGVTRFAVTFITFKNIFGYKHNLQASNVDKHFISHKLVKIVARKVVSVIIFGMTAL